MIERRITFIIGDNGIPAWKLSQLKTLAGYFRSVIIMLNITHRRQANIAQTIQIMSLGCKPSDLCQLLIEGTDAEQAYMVLTDFIAEHFILVNTHKQKKIHHTGWLEDDDGNNNYFYLPFKMKFTSQVLNVDGPLNEEKPALLAELCSMLNIEKSALLLDLMLKREAVSPTAMGNGIALPHVMSAEIERPAMAMIQTIQPVEWGGDQGPVTRLIAMALPAPAQRQHIQAFSHFSKSLLDPIFCHFLTDNTESKTLKTIILHTLSRPFHVN